MNSIDRKDEIQLENLGNLLRSNRIMMGLSQTQVADMVGITMQHYSRIERGEYIPSLQTFFSLIDCLNIDISKLKIEKSISSTMYEIMNLLGNFNDKQQKAVLSFLKTMEPVA